MYVATTSFPVYWFLVVCGLFQESNEDASQQSQSKVPKEDRGSPQSLVTGTVPSAKDEEEEEEEEEGDRIMAELQVCL